MGETTNEIKDEQNESADEIRAGIEHTREEMGETIDALQNKLSPQQLKEDAKAAVMNRAQDAAQNAKEKVVEIKEQVSAAPTPQDKGAVLLDAIKRNPIPAALLGLGVLWLGWKLLHGGDDD